LVFVMERLTAVSDMKAWSRALLKQSRTIGFVPTMGYLHEGHLALMRRARAENDRVLVSIFVNPTQFGPSEDLNRYPRDLEGDAKKCSDVGVDALFLPEASQVYPPGFQTYVDVEEVSRPLCGASRPGHFRGVATIVLKLFNIVAPTRAYFGEKDRQQLRVIMAMAVDLDLDVEIVPCETVREADGLAMSSRNAYLSPDQRKQAVCLHQALLEAAGLFDKGERNADRYVRTMSQRIAQEPDAGVDYISLVHPETLQALTDVDDAAVAALAVKIGDTRLIDNMLFNHRSRKIQQT